MCSFGLKIKAVSRVFLMFALWRVRLRNGWGFPVQKTVLFRLDAGERPLRALDGNQHDAMSMQLADQADQASLIHHDVREGGRFDAVRQRFRADLGFAEPAPPRIVRSTVDLDLVFVLRIQTDVVRHVRSLHYANPRTNPKIRNRKNTLCPE